MMTLEDKDWYEYQRYVSKQRSDFLYNQWLATQDSNEQRVSVSEENQ